VDTGQASLIYGGHRPPYDKGLRLHLKPGLRAVQLNMQMEQHWIAGRRERIMVGRAHPTWFSGYGHGGVHGTRFFQDAELDGAWNAPYIAISGQLSAFSSKVLGDNVMGTGHHVLATSAPGAPKPGGGQNGVVKYNLGTRGKSPGFGTSPGNKNNFSTYGGQCPPYILPAAIMVFC
jgi:hypothetical protein